MPPPAAVLPPSVRAFAPAPGTIEILTLPVGPGIRVDSGVEAGSEVTPMYDPMVAKLIVWDVDRESATRRMARALDEFEVEELQESFTFLRRTPPPVPPRSGKGEVDVDLE